MTTHTEDYVGKLRNAIRSVSDCLRQVGKLDEASVLDGFSVGYEQSALEVIQHLLGQAIHRNGGK